MFNICPLLIDAFFTLGEPSSQERIRSPSLNLDVLFGLRKKINSSASASKGRKLFQSPPDTQNIGEDVLDSLMSSSRKRKTADDDQVIGPSQPPHHPPSLLTSGSRTSLSNPNPLLQMPVISPRPEYTPLSRPEPTTSKAPVRMISHRPEPTQTQLDDFSLSGLSGGLEPDVGEKILSQLEILNTNLCKHFQIIYSRMDELGEKVDLLGRRIETEDSSFRLTTVQTVEEFNSGELQLKDKEKFQLLVCK